MNKVPKILFVTKSHVNECVNVASSKIPTSAKEEFLRNENAEFLEHLIKTNQLIGVAYERALKTVRNLRAG